VDALRTVDNHVQGPLIVDVHAGLPSGDVPLSVGGISVASIRADNCGGDPWPPVMRRFERSAGSLTICGHRGVSAEHLHQSIRQLLDSGEQIAARVLTHEVPLDAAADVINSVLTSESRALDGKRLLKAAIRIEDQG
jgi:hypothetical protein